MSKTKPDEELKSALPELINRIQTGDTQAREELAVLLFPYICTLITKYKNTIDDDIDSLAGQIIIKLLNKVDTIDTTKSVIGFVTRTAINTAIDAHRRYKANKIHNTIEYQAFRDYDTSYELSGLSVDSLENAESILKDYLSTDDAEVVSLYYLHGKSLEQISEDTGFRVEDIQHTLDYAERNISRSII